MSRILRARIARTTLTAGLLAAGIVHRAAASIVSAGDTLPPVNLPADGILPGGIFVGDTTTGTLTLDGGSQFNSQFGSIGHQPGGDGAVNLTEGSSWEMDFGLEVGNAGAGQLHISGDSFVSAGFTRIGSFSGGSGVATVQGGGRFALDGNLEIGSAGIGALIIRDGGTVDASATFLGASGLNSRGTLSIAAGGVLSSGFATLAQDANSVATASLDGGTWNYRDFMIVGRGGTATLTVHGGARIAGPGSIIGENDTADATVLVHGSTWSQQGFMDVARAGRARLDIQNRAAVSNHSGGIGIAPSADGTVALTGASTWDNSQFLTIGGSGKAILTIEGGSAVTNTSGVIALQPGSAAEVRVSGENSRWTNSTFLEVGREGNGTLMIQNGAEVSNTSAVLAGEAASIASVTVDNRSSWINSSFMTVGQKGNATLSIGGGSTVSGTQVVLALEADSKATVALTGNDTTWTTSDSFEVGRNGRAHLAIGGGARLQAGGITFVGTESGVGNIDINAGGMLDSVGQLAVGRGRVQVVDGGMLKTAKLASATGSSAVIGGSAGQGAVVAVLRGGRWTQDGVLNVGFRGVGMLHISSSGSVQSRDGVIARLPNSSGTVDILEQGAKWMIDQSLAIGGTLTEAGGSGTLTIRDGGELTAGGAMRIWSGSSVRHSGITFSAKALINDGTFEQTNGNVSFDGVDGAGFLQISGGTLTANHIRQFDVVVFGPSSIVKIRPSGDGDVHDNNGTSVIHRFNGGISRFELANNGLILKNFADLSLVRGRLRAGRGSSFGGVADGRWDGTFGFTSASAAARRIADNKETRSLGYALNSDRGVGVLTEFMGQPVDPTDVLIRYTRNGDATLDGRVDNNDITVLAGFYRPDHDPNGAAGPRHWYQADFNYDGIVNNNDITILAGFYQPNAVALAPSASSGLAAVPEPASAILAAAAALAGTWRRRRAAIDAR